MLTVHVSTVHAEDRVGSSTYVRLLLPLCHPAHGGRFVVTHSSDYAPADVVIVERSWTDNMSQARDLVARCRAGGSCLIYSTDDNLLDVKIEGPTTRWLSAAHQEIIRYVAAQADRVIVSTEPLREQMAQFNADVVVIENALDERLVPSPRQARHPPAGNDEKFVVGYMGTATHNEDLAMIAPALRRVLRRHDGRIELQLVGAIADPESLRALTDLPVRVLQVGHDVEYPSFMKWMARALRWDLGIAPLRDDPFTRCKSDIKFLDYAALGIPGLFSRVRPYDRSVRHLDTGCLIDNEPGEWEDAIERFIADPDLLRQIGANASDYLLTSRTLRTRADDWGGAILPAVRNRRDAGSSAVARRHAPRRQEVGGKRALVVIPGSVNYFYNRAGERLAESLGDLGWCVRVRPIESAIGPHPDEPTEFDYTFFINPSELAAARRDTGALMRALETLRDRSTWTAAVGLECAHTSWFAASARLCRDAGIAALLDLGFHDQYQELKPEHRDFYRFCFNGLTRAERLTVPIGAAPQDHPIPWAFVGSLSPQRAALAWRLVHEASPEGFLYLPHLSPVTESGPHLNERQFQSVLRKARCQVWCSHHGHFYLESERFRNSLLTGGLPLKVMTAPAPPERILPFGNLMCTEQDAPARLRQLEENYQTAWRAFADEFMALPSLERGLAAFLEDEMGAATALDAPHETGQSDARGARRVTLTKEQGFDRAAIQPA